MKYLISIIILTSCSTSCEQNRPFYQWDACNIQDPKYRPSPCPWVEKNNRCCPPSGC